MKIVATLLCLLAAGPSIAAQGPGVRPGDADWLVQLPAQLIVLMMAGFVLFAFIKKRWDGAVDK